MKYFKLTVMKENSIEMPSKGLKGGICLVSGRQKMSSVFFLSFFLFFLGKGLLYRIRGKEYMLKSEIMLKN